MTHALSAGWSPFQIAGSLQSASNRETGVQRSHPAGVRTPLAGQHMIWWMLSAQRHSVVLPMPFELLYVAGRRPCMRLQSATMNDIASWLRAQISSSNDPDRLERLAREAERQAVMRSGIATRVRERAPSRPPSDGASRRGSLTTATSRPAIGSNPNLQTLQD